MSSFDIKKKQGFTLIEVLVVIVIVAILASLAYGQYSNHVMKSRRSEAMDMATQAASLQERFFFSNNKYATNSADDLKALGGDGKNTDGYYELEVAPSDDEAEFTVIVKPKTDKSQSKDADCQFFSIDQSGRRYSSDDKNGGGTNTTDICWRKQLYFSKAAVQNGGFFNTVCEVVKSRREVQVIKRLDQTDLVPQLIEEKRRKTDNQIY